MKAFCKDDQYWTENLQKEYMLMKATCSQHHFPTTIGLGNIKARLRMIYLYDLANYTSGLVMDTDNLTEHYLGFFTIHGDVCDFNPIGGLWKHEVYELATYLRDTYDRHTRYYADSFGSVDDRREIETNERKVEALNYALGIRPTDGNGVNDLGDMGQIAPTFAHDKNVDAYTKVDDIIQTYLNIQSLSPEMQEKHLDKLREKYPNIEDNGCVIHDTVYEVISRIKRTEYKRKGLPVVINRNLYL
jgi:NH3-dependent NAD+ synthetase